MTTEEARYYRARNAAQAAWQATEPQLVMWDVLNSGLDDGPLTATDGRKHTSSVYRERTGAIIEPAWGVRSGYDQQGSRAHREGVTGWTLPHGFDDEGVRFPPVLHPGTATDTESGGGSRPSQGETSMGVDANSPEGTSVHPQNGA